MNKIPPSAPDLLRKKVSGFQELTAYYPFWSKTTIRPVGKPAIDFDCHVPGSQLPASILADDRYFGTFHYTWLAGSPSGEFEKPNRVVISENRANTYFGNGSPQSFLGREIVYNDSLRVTVVGVVKDWTEHSDFPFTDIISMATIRSPFLRDDYNNSDWNGRSAACFVKLPAGFDPARLKPALAGFLKTYDFAQPDSHLELELQPLNDIHFNAKYHGDDFRTAHKPTLYGLIGLRTE